VNAVNLFSMTVPLLRYVFVEGNIAAGKSTFISNALEPFRGQCKARHDGAADAVAVLEPVHEWTAVGGDPQHNMLAAFYGDKRRWASTFQSHVLVTRVTAINEAVVSWCLAREREGDARHATDPNFVLYVLCERSTHTDRHVFVRALQEEGAMTPLEVAVYESLWQFWNARLHPGTVACVVHIATKTDDCAQQLASRSRAEEQGDGAVPREYLLALERLHESAISGTPETWSAAPRVRIAHGPFHTDADLVEGCVAKIAQSACPSV